MTYFFCRKNDLKLENFAFNIYIAKLALQISYDMFIGTPIYKSEGFKAGKTACGFNVY
jgi:hypothetical protein